MKAVITSLLVATAFAEGATASEDVVLNEDNNLDEVVDDGITFEEDQLLGEENATISGDDPENKESVVDEDGETTVDQEGQETEGEKEITEDVQDDVEDELQDADEEVVAEQAPIVTTSAITTQDTVPGEEGHTRNASIEYQTICEDLNCTLNVTQYGGLVPNGDSSFQGMDSNYYTWFFVYSTSDSYTETSANMNGEQEMTIKQGISSKMLSEWKADPSVLDPHLSFSSADISDPASAGAVINSETGEVWHSHSRDLTMNIEDFWSVENKIILNFMNGYKRKADLEEEDIKWGSRAYPVELTLLSEAISLSLAASVPILALLSSF